MEPKPSDILTGPSRLGVGAGAACNWNGFAIGLPYALDWQSMSRSPTSLATPPLRTPPGYNVLLAAQPETPTSLLHKLLEARWGASPGMGPDVAGVAPRCNHEDPDVAAVGPGCNHWDPDVAGVAPRCNHKDPDVAAVGPGHNHWDPDVAGVGPGCNNESPDMAGM